MCAVGVVGLSAVPAEAQGSPADPGSCRPSGAGHLAYSTNLDTDYNSVSVVDTKDLRVQRYIPGFRVPSNVTVLNDGSKLYVDQWYTGDANTKVVNPCTGQIVKTITRPGGLFPLTNLSPDGRWLYLSTIQGFTIEKIDTRTDEVVHTYSTQPTGEPIGSPAPNTNGALTAFGPMVTGTYHTGPGEIAVYDTHSLSPVKTTPRRR